MVAGMLQVTLQRMDPKVQVFDATPFSLRMFNSVPYLTTSFTGSYDNKTTDQLGVVNNVKENTVLLLNKDDFFHFVTSSGDLRYLKSAIVISNEIAAPTPAPTPTPTPEESNAALFVDVLKNIFDASQHKQDGADTVGNITKDILKMHREPGNGGNDNGDGGEQDQRAQDQLQADQDRQNHFHEGLDMIQRDNEERARQEREQQERDRQQQYLDQQQRNQRNNN